MKDKIIIFGAGKISEVISTYLKLDDEFEICAYVVDAKYLESETFLDRPLISEEEAFKKYSPKQYKCFIALGYHNNNLLRKEKFELFKNKGYRFVNYIDKKIRIDVEVGENVFIMDDALIQPKVKIGNNVFIFGGAMVGHHSNIKDNCWITGGALIGGSVIIGDSTFLAMGTTVAHETHVGKNCFLGANILVSKNLPDNSVVIKSDTDILRLNTEQFLKITKLK